MSIVTRGFLSNTIITRGYGQGLLIIVRDIARLTSKVIRSVSLESLVTLSDTVVSRVYYRASVTSAINKTANLVSPREDAEIISKLDLEKDDL